jgi:polysaccharide export outer membrane protein
MAQPTIEPVHLVGHALRGMARGAAIVGLLMVPMSTAWAQGAAPADATASATSAAGNPAAARVPVSAVPELPVVPAERSVPGSFRIEPVEEDYRIGTQDLIEVQVLGIQELRREARVNAKGMIGMPLIGAVRVAGLTTAEAEALIAGLYNRNYLQNPEVSVFVKEYTRQNITVDGAVAKPGIYPLKGPTTLLQAIANAGGPGALADPSDVVLFRMEEGERRALKFDVAKIRSAEAPDPVLQPGDLIVVNRSPARVAVRDSLFGDILQVIFNPFTSIVKP